MQTDSSVPTAAALDAEIPVAASPVVVPEVEVAVPHSRLGLVSLVASLVAGTCLALAIGYQIAVVYLFDEAALASDAPLAWLLLAATCLAFFALGLGIGGLYQSGRHKLFAILGSFSSTLVCTAVVITLVMTVVVYLSM